MENILNRGIDAIYVYSDVIQSKLVGDSSVLLLDLVPLCGVLEEMAFIEYYSPVYTSDKICVFHNRNVHNGHNLQHF